MDITKAKKLAENLLGTKISFSIRMEGDGPIDTVNLTVEEFLNPTMGPYYDLCQKDRSLDAVQMCLVLAANLKSIRDMDDEVLRAKLEEKRGFSSMLAQAPEYMRTMAEAFSADLTGMVSKNGVVDFSADNIAKQPHNAAEAGGLAMHLWLANQCEDIISALDIAPSPPLSRTKIKELLQSTGIHTGPRSSSHAL